MQAYENALKAGDTRLLLSPDSQFFQYFNDAMGRGGGTGAPAAAQPQSAPGAAPQSDPLPEGEQDSGLQVPAERDAGAGSTGAVTPVPQAQ
jgi:hypothetical protein